MKRKFRVLAATVLALGMAGIGSARLTHAATDTVTTCSGDPNSPGSLPNEVANATPGDTVEFSLDCSGSNTVALTNVMNITQDVVIDGSGHSVVISGRDSTRLFAVGSQARFGLTGLTLSHGSALGGGGAIFNGGTLTVTNSTLANNSVGTNGAGGAIFNEGTLTITNSTLTDNRAGSYGGAILNFAAVTLTDSTLAGNSAGDGGAIYNFGALAVTNSTLAGNSSTLGGGAIHNDSDATESIGGSIVASSTGGNCANSGAASDNGYNLEWSGTGNTDSCGFSAGTDMTGQDPKLDPGGLADNGGPTPTIALQSDSPAIDQIPTSDSALCPPSGGTDQRGGARPDNSETSCDIGAYEFADTATTTTTTVNSSANPSVVGQAVTYTATVRPAPDAGTVEFMDGTTDIATCGSVPVSSGEATCTLTYSSVGSHIITAIYSGDSNHQVSSSGALTQLVEYGVKLVYKLNAMAKAGRTLPIKIELVNYSGQNLSSSSLQVTALCVVVKSATDCSGSPPISYGTGSTFAEMADLDGGGGYQFNVKSTGLAIDTTYTLLFRAADEPSVDPNAIYHADANANFTLTK